MKRIAKIFLALLLVLVGLTAVAITFTVGWRPVIGPKARPLTARVFDRTPQRLERGRYMAAALNGCIYCHSPHDWNATGTPYVPGMEGAGAIMPETNLPGRVVAPNLTPDPETGTGRWTDDQLARAIREGVGHHGRALFPMMPYSRYREMTDEDLASVVVCLRSLPAVRNHLPPTEIIFPVKYLIRGVPQPVTSPVHEAATNDPVKRGAQLVNLAGCPDCHTPQVRGKTVPGMEVAGGISLSRPWGSVSAANLTPDASGISYYDEALFLEVIRTGQVKARALSPIMPFKVYQNLTDDDLKAMFAYLRTLKPVKHRVDNSQAPTLCKRCKQKHGAGAEN